MVGKNGIAVGNQQFTVRNLTVNNAVVGECIISSLSTTTLTPLEGISAVWSWGTHLIFVLRMMYAHGLGRLDLSTGIHQQLLGMPDIIPQLF